MFAFEVLYLTLIASISLYGLHRYWLAFGAGRAVEPGPPPTLPVEAAEWPRVLIQLPVFNEPAVVLRLIRAAAAIDWPTDRLEIQVLDDSNDGSSDDIAVEVERLAGEGLAIRHVRREDRTGYKAGALQAGLELTDCDLVAIFDADFVPPADFLQRTVGYFCADDRLGMVQGRWGFSNPGTSWLTRTQAILLDGHFHVEHRARAAAGRFFNFNGTAGIWRVATIEDAGGWKSDTVTEDLELSLRAWLAGWRFRYLDDLEVPSDLPESMAAFKIQQNRWVSGSMHTAAAWLFPILRSRRSAREKVDLAFYLTGNLNYLLLLLLVLAVPPAILLRLGDGARWLWADLPFFVFATVSVVCFYGRARRPKSRPLSYFLVRLPCLMALGLGMTVHNTRAVIKGVLGRSRVFERTPKKREGGDRPAAGRRRRDGAMWIEAAMALYVLAAMVVSVRGGSLVSIPLLALFAGGYLAVFLRTVRATPER